MPAKPSEIIPSTPEEVRAEILKAARIEPIVFEGQVKQLSEVLAEINPTGSEVKLREFVDQEITIWAISPTFTSYGPAAQIVYTTQDNVLYNSMVFQKVILPKLMVVMDRLPVKCTLREKQGGLFGSYFDLE
jgi:hypothetical protein